MFEELLSWLYDASKWVLPVLLAITLHEAAHGWMAAKFGDPTATLLGRVTLNPFKHIDRFGTVILPALLVTVQSPFIIGYAKPVPVDFGRLKPERLGIIAVALAGPGANLLLAMIAGLLLHIESFITPEQAPWLFESLYRAIVINCVIMIFNLLPVLPLDGGRVLSALLPGKMRFIFMKMEKIGLWLVVAIFMVGPLMGVNVTENLVGTPVNWAVEQVLWLTGNGS